MTHIRSRTALATLAALCAARGWASTAPAEEITAAPPIIPAARFVLTDYGAVGDGKTFDTDAFRKAVAAVAQAGGGHLIVPAGTYKTRAFALASHMDLHLDPGAIIKASGDLADYGLPDPNTTPASAMPTARPTPLITCPPGTTDLAITGSGTVDGSGAIFWTWSDKYARRYPAGRAVVPRPALISLTGVQRLHVAGITLTNSPMSHLIPRGQDILIEDVRIVAPSDAPNTDALDPGGRRIVIRRCEIDTGDDDVALQSGSQDVLIEDLTCLHGHGISIGSPTQNGLSHVVVRRCTFDGTDNGLRIKSYRGRGGEVHDIRYSDITMKNVRRPFDINMRYDGNDNVTSDVGPREAGPGQTIAVPFFHDIHITNLSVTRSPVAGRIVGIPERPARDITFTNVTIQSDRGFLVQDAQGVTFQKTTVTPAVGAPLVLANAAVVWNGTPKIGPLGGPPEPFYPGN